MTTEELAQLIEDAHPRGFVKDAADLLRQLQAELDDCKAQLEKEIEMLKQIIDANNLKSDIGQFIRPIDEPVAWIAIGDNTSVFFDLDCALSIDDNPTPLYTHPAKTLTDGEILNIYLEQTNGNKDLDILEFAKLILKKAGEK